MMATRQNKKNPYEVLGVNLMSSDEDIKQAFRRLALQFHPDKNPEHKSRFLEISEAYDVIKTAAGRSAYNMSNGRVRRRKRKPAPPPSYASPEEDTPPHMRQNIPPNFERRGQRSEWDFGNIFGFGNEQVNPQQVYTPPKKERIGENLNCTLDITLEEAFQGVRKIVSYDRMIRCHSCHGTGSSDLETKKCKKCYGTGKLNGDTYCPNPCTFCKGKGVFPNMPCLVCSGEGRVKVPAEEEVELKPGAYSNQTITRYGKGNELSVQGKDGDLVITVKVKPHKRFRQVFKGLETTVEISYAESVLGTEKLIPLLDEGKQARIKIEPGTAHGNLFTIKEMGMPRLYMKEREDLYVKIEVVPPKSITQKEKELYQQILNIEKKKEV